MNLGISTGALKPMRPFLLARGVDTDDIFPLDAAGQEEAAGSGGIERELRVFRIKADIDAA